MQFLNNEQVLNLINNSEKIVGTKQSIRAIISSTVKCVIVASNTDKHILDQIIAVCEKSNVEVYYYLDKKALGQLMKIPVACSCVAVLNS